MASIFRGRILSVFAIVIVALFAIAAFNTSTALAESSGVSSVPNALYTLRNAPTQVGIASDWIAISTGGSHSLAINSSGELYAWGSNNRGQTGLGTDTGNTLAPTRVGTASNWTAIAAGNNYSLAINSSGELWAWGSNGSGHTGLGTTVGNTLTPARVGTASNWTTIAAGAALITHSLAINSSGELWAWGSNSNNSLGLGGGGARNVPTRVGTASNWTTIAVGHNHSLAINSSGELYAWGHNGNGKTGFDTIAGNTPIPTRVGTASNWTAVAAGGSHSLAINSSGELWSWGQNTTHGATGLGTNIGNTLTPTRVGIASDWTIISASSNTSLAINSSGELWAWGSGGTGLASNNILTPTRVGTASNWTAISAASTSLAIGEEAPTRTVTFNIFDLAEGAVWSAETPVTATFNLDVPVGTTISLAWLEANLPANLLTHLQRTGFNFESFVGGLTIAEGEGNQVINMLFRAEQVDPPPVLCPDCNNPIDNCSCPPPPVLCPDCNNPLDECSCPPSPVVCADCNRYPCVCDTETLETTPTPDNDNGNDNNNNDRRDSAAGPKTGDMSNPTMLLAQMIVAVMLFAAIVYRLSCPSGSLTKREI